MQSLRNFPDAFLAEICEQPAAIRRAAGGLAVQVEQLERVSGESARGGRTLLFTGMGGSYHACYPAISQLADHGIPALLVDTAELLHFRRAVLQAGALVVVVSQSGRSAEIVRLGEQVRAQSPETRPFVVAVTNGTDNPLAAMADVAFDTRAGAELGPSTMTFAASLVALSGLARAMAGEDPQRSVEWMRLAAEEAATGAERILDHAEEEAEVLLQWHGGRTTTILLGRGPARAASEMGALLLKESVGIPAEALQAAQFRHGPLELAGPNLAAFVVATEEETSELDLQLAADLLEAGSAVLVVTRDGRSPSGAQGVGIGAIDRMLAPAVSIVPAQLLAWRLATERGRTPGVLTRASKVTTDE